MNLSDANKALRFIDWSELLSSGKGTKFVAMLDGEHIEGEVVDAVDREDEDNDRTLSLTVEFGGSFFRQTGYAEVGSHCYGEYEPSWYGLKPVTPRETTVVVYDEV